MKRRVAIHGFVPVLMIIVLFAAVSTGQAQDKKKMAMKESSITGEVVDVSCYLGHGAKGEGHKMIQERGGYFTHMEHIWFYVYATPDYRDPQQRRGLVFRMVPGYIWLNQQGRRFHNESLTGGASAACVLPSSGMVFGSSVATQASCARRTSGWCARTCDSETMKSVTRGNPRIQAL